MNCKIAVIGATTSVGKSILSYLSEMGVSADNVAAVTDSDKVKRDISYGENHLISVARIGDYNFSDVGIVIFVSTDAISERYVKAAVEKGCVVVDSTSHYRMADGVPLVIPHINGRDAGVGERSIIATPCSAVMQLLTVLSPLQQRVRIERVVLSTYHSASNVGLDGMAELYDQTKSMFMNQKVRSKEFPRQISFNCIPCVGDLVGEGHTTEEIGIVEESQRILGGDVEIFATCVTVPVFVSNSMVVNLEFGSYVSVEDIVELLGDAPGVAVINPESDMVYATPVDCVNDEEVYVSRIRTDRTVTHGVSMWLVADNVKLSASYITQVAKILMEGRI